LFSFHEAVYTDFFKNGVNRIKGVLKQNKDEQENHCTETQKNP